MLKLPLQMAFGIGINSHKAIKNSGTYLQNHIKITTFKLRIKF